METICIGTIAIRRTALVMATGCLQYSSYFFGSTNSASRVVVTIETVIVAEIEEDLFRSNYSISSLILLVGMVRSVVVTVVFTIIPAVDEVETMPVVVRFGLGVVVKRP